MIINLVLSSLAQLELKFGEAAQDTLPYAEKVVADGSSSFVLTLIGNLLSLAMMFGALIVLAFLIMGAFEWITSAGDTGKLEKARNRITQAIVGLILLSTTLAIFTFIQSWLGIEVINFKFYDEQGSDSSPGSSGGSD
jgi:magnesium-transporting ATPase (P-type)